MRASAQQSAALLSNQRQLKAGKAAQVNSTSDGDRMPSRTVCKLVSCTKRQMKQASVVQAIIPDAASTWRSSRLMHVMLCMPCRLTMPFSNFPLVLASSMQASCKEVRTNALHICLHTILSQRFVFWMKRVGNIGSYMACCLRLPLMFMPEAAASRQNMQAWLNSIEANKTPC